MEDINFIRHKHTYDKIQNWRMSGSIPLVNIDGTHNFKDCTENFIFEPTSSPDNPGNPNSPGGPGAPCVKTK